MRLAWFRPAPVEHPSAIDATAPLIAALRATHELDVYTRANVHDFVWTHFRAPYGVSIFELDNTASHAFIWPYLLHYGGVLLLHSPRLHDVRARALVETGRRDDYAAEFLFSERHAARLPTRSPWICPGHWPMLRVPLTAAHATVVPYRSLAEVLRDQYPGMRILHAPLGVGPSDPRQRAAAAGRTVVTFGILAGDRVDVARRALARAQEAGAAAALLVDASSERVLREADAVLVLSWPSDGEGPRLARAAMAAGAPVIALETILTADWPALDPQTWRPRDRFTSRPASAGPASTIAVTVDLRDEEHSLSLAIRRLSADAVLRTQLGEAARAWSRAHERLAAAVDAWASILEEAVRLAPTPRPADWPRHLAADGSGRARAILEEFGVGVDLF